MARGDDEPGSDIDSLVDFTDEASLLDEFGLRLALVDLLGVEVDVVAVASLQGEMRERVLLDAGARLTDAPSKATDAADRGDRRLRRACGPAPGRRGDFVGDVRTQWAVEIGLIRICEDVNRMPAEVLERFPEQPWRHMNAMRNFAAHQYDDLDPRRAWRTVTRDVPRLRDYLADTVIPRLNR